MDAAATRGLDLIAASCLLVLLSPLMGVIAVRVRRDSAGPVLYRALRVGRDGRPFYLLKFRTMVVDADRGAAVTGKADRRVTRVGRHLRATRLDELPQLVNVVRGEMSLVGPRPEAPAIVRHYAPEHLAVLRIRPGITGPTQLAFRDEPSLLTEADVEAQYLRDILPSKLASDLAYVRERTVIGDVRLLVATARLVTASILGSEGGAGRT